MKKYEKNKTISTSRKSNDQGRGYEFAWFNALFNILTDFGKVNIIYNSSYEANKNSYDALPDDILNSYKLSIESAIFTILELEPNLYNFKNNLVLEFLNDQAGKIGDVRDIVVKEIDSDYEIGFSIKHNHEAIKHSRLSAKLDFGKVWYGQKCSQVYWDEVKPIFAELEKKKKLRLKWSEISNKEEEIYFPLLEAFRDK